MLHLLLAGLVLISSSQTTTNTSSHGRTDPFHGGAVFTARVQITHATPPSPVTSLDRRRLNVLRERFQTRAIDRLHAPAVQLDSPRVLQPQ